MPSPDDELEVVNSSDTTDLDEQQSAAATKDATAEGADDAKSSNATGEEDKSLLDVVRDVVDQRSKPEAASPAEGEEDGKTAEKQAKEPDDEHYSDVPFNKHPRFQQLLRESKAHREDAERYHNVVGFLDQHGLTSDEAGDILVIGALAKTNPAEAWKRAKPWVQNLLVAAGEVLPEDLQHRVQAGEFTTEAALEISRSRATAQSVQAAQSFQQQQAERRQQQELANSVIGAAVSWEKERRLRDPNFDAKMPALQKEIAWLQAQEGKPKTPDGVKAQLAKAYKAVNASLPAQQPTPQRRPAVKPVGGGQVAGTARPANMSTLDIVRARGAV